MTIQEEINDEQRQKLADMFEDGSFLTDNLDHPTSDATQPPKVKYLPGSTIQPGQETIPSPSTLSPKRSVLTKRGTLAIAGGLFLVIAGLGLYLAVA